MYDDTDIEKLISDELEQYDSYIADNGFVEGVMASIPKKKSRRMTTAAVFYASCTLFLLAAIAWHLPIIGWYYDFTSWFVSANSTEVLYIVTAMFFSLASILWSVKKSVYF